MRDSPTLAPPALVSGQLSAAANALRPFAFPVAWVLVIATLTLPPAYTLPGVGLDPSWLAGLNMAFQRQLHWGSALMWTYGPFGFADSTAYFYANTWQIALVVTVVVHLFFFASVAAFLHSIGGTRWRWALAAAVFLIPLTEFPKVEYECAIAAMLLLFMSAVADRSAPAAWLAVVGGATLGLLVTIKGTGLAAAAGLLVAYGAFVLFTRRPALIATLAASVAVSFLTLWTIAGQSLSDIGPYVRGSYEIVSGYSAAMSLLFDAPLPVHHITAQVVFGALAVISSAASLAWALLRRDRQLICLLLLATPLLFLDFKEGYVRFGNRQLVFYSLAAVVETLVLLRTLRSGPGRWSAFGWLQSGAVAAVSAALLAGLAAATGSVPSQGAWPVATAGQRLSSYADATGLIGSPTRRAQLTASIVTAIQDSYGLAGDTLGSQETTDILPWDVEIAYAYAVRWSPRPVLQSYSAYTPYLDHLDAAHLEGPNAPERLLVAYRSIDGRYPPFDEPALFRAIYAHYQVVGVDHDFVILARRPYPASTQLHRISTTRARLGDFVPVPFVPDGGVLYASVNVPYSLKGQLTNLLFQPAKLYVQFRLSSGDVGPYRFIPRVAADGLMLSSYIANVDDLRRVLERRLDQPIRAIQILTHHESDYTGLVDITFYSSTP